MRLLLSVVIIDIVWRTYRHRAEVLDSLIVGSVLFRPYLKGKRLILLVFFILFYGFDVFIYLLVLHARSLIVM